MGYKSCDNCLDWKCRRSILAIDLDPTVPCDDWKKIPCPICGGTLSEIRENGEAKYRHCYSCHLEFSVDEIATDVLSGRNK